MVVVWVICGCCDRPDLGPGPGLRGGHQEHPGSREAAGLGALIVRVQPLFEAIRWAGVAYLLALGVQALRSAVRGRNEAAVGERAERGGLVAFDGWRQGFLCNITNPKVLVFYLAVLPQFLAPDAGIVLLGVFAVSQALLGLGYLRLLTLHRARRLLARRRVHRSLDAATATVLLGFSARLATEDG